MSLSALVQIVLLVKRFPEVHKITQFVDYKMIVFLTYLGIFMIIFLLPSWKSAGYRIGMGYLLFYICATLPLLVLFFKKYKEKFIAFGMFLIVNLLIIKGLYNIENKSQLFQKYTFIPPKYPRANTKVVKIGSIDFHIVIQDEPKEVKHCWGSPIPCYSEYPGWVLPRGDRLSKGFKWNPVYENRYEKKDIK